MKSKKVTIAIVLFALICLLSSCTAANEAAAPGDGDAVQTGAGDTVQPGDATSGLKNSTAENAGTENGTAGNVGSDRITDENTDSENLREYVSGTDELNAADRIRNALQSNDNPAVNDDLIRLFFEYQLESHNSKGPYHQYELRMLPEFGEKKALDWDGMTVFIHFMANSFKSDDEGYSFFTGEEFDRTADRLFADLDYQHRSSSYFKYAQGIYKSTGWDVNGGVYYRLKEISRDGSGIFTASFDGFAFHEFDSFDASADEVSENMKAVIDYAGDRKNEAGMHDILLEIFLRDNYDEILHTNQHLKISFRLSSDPEFAFEYLSCEREYL